jgi:hypothetical protein
LLRSGRLVQRVLGCSSIRLAMASTASHRQACCSQSALGHSSR